MLPLLVFVILLLDLFLTFVLLRSLLHHLFIRFFPEILSHRNILLVFQNIGCFFDLNGQIANSILLEIEFASVLQVGISHSFITTTFLIPYVLKWLLMIIIWPFESFCFLILQLVNDAGLLSSQRRCWLTSILVSDPHFLSKLLKSLFLVKNQSWRWWNISFLEWRDIGLSLVLRCK